MDTVRNDVAASAVPPCDPMLDLLAGAISYPGPGTRTAVLAVAASLATEAQTPGYQAAANALEALATWLAAAAPGVAEERYSLLFDLSPVCTLNIGYHLFGESYERGAFLAGLMGELHKVGLSPGDELPDHLGNLLRLLARLTDKEDSTLLLGHALLPGLRRVRQELKEGSDPWTPVLRSLPEFLAERAERGGLELAPDVPSPRRLRVLPEGAVSHPYPEVPATAEEPLVEANHA